MIETHTGRRMFVTAEQGIALWQLMSGERKPKTKKEQLYKQSTKRVFLSRLNAPESYVKRYGHLFNDGRGVIHKQHVQARLPYKD